MAWQSFTIPKVPSPLAAGVEGLQGAITAATAGLKILKSLTAALSAVTSTSLSAAQITLQSAVFAVEAALKSLTEDTGVYVLLVPPRSRVILPPEVAAAATAAATSTVSREGVVFQGEFGQPANATEAALLRSLFTAQGGNAAFVRAVIESFDDQGDHNRPTLAVSDAVAGMYIVAGAANFASLIPFTNGISSVLVPGNPTTLDAPAIPTPQGLRARRVAGPSVLLQWEYQEPFIELPVLATSAEITEIAIIRSPSVRLLSASSPKELFGTGNLTVGTKTSDGTEVIAVIPMDGDLLVPTYLDSAPPEQGKSYYYTISYKVTLGTQKELAAGTGRDMGFIRLSNVAKVHLPKTAQMTPRSAGGAPPDWYRTPRTVDLFPAFGKVLNQVSALTSQFGATTTGFVDLLKSNTSLIEQQIKNYETLASELTAAASSISAFATLDLGAVSSRPFAGTGGVPFVKRDIIKAFGDTTDPHRPPFDGQEFVAGVVILATTPNAVALLQTFFGSVTAAVGDIAAALEKIDVVLTTVETTAFSDDMSPGVSAQPPHAASSSFLVIGEETQGFCYHSFESSPSFDDNLTPK